MKKKKEILYAHVSANTKVWLKRLSKKQPGYTSLSTMLEKILKEYRTRPSATTR